MPQQYSLAYFPQDRYYINDKEYSGEYTTLIISRAGNVDLILIPHMQGEKLQHISNISLQSLDLSRNQEREIIFPEKKIKGNNMQAFSYNIQKVSDVSLAKIQEINNSTNAVINNTLLVECKINNSTKYHMIYKNDNISEEINHLQSKTFESTSEHDILSILEKTATKKDISHSLEYIQKKPIQEIYKELDNLSKQSVTNEHNNTSKNMNIITMMLFMFLNILLLFNRFIKVKHTNQDPLIGKEKNNFTGNTNIKLTETTKFSNKKER